MISLHALEKVVKTPRSIVRVLKGITLQIERGEIFGVIGQDITGKSALARCVNLLERPTNGTVLMDNCDLTALDAASLRRARRRIGTVFQDANLLSLRTVYDNIALPLTLAGHPKADIGQTVRPLLALTGLLEKATAYPHQLTTGQKRRVAIARALVNTPKVLLCEDPTGALDSKTSHGILQLLQEIHKQLHLTLIILTQDVEVIKTICHRVAVLHRGEIVEQNHVPEFFARPQSDMAKELIRTATCADLPMAWRRRLRSHPNKHAHPVLRLACLDSTTQEPLISHLTQHHDLLVNIIQAHLENVGDASLAIVLLEVVGEPDNVQRGIAFLESKTLNVEVLGYVTRTA